MREIKFRGKRKDNGEWVYGWYAPLVCNDRTIIPNIKDSNGSDWKIKEETVGQYTGLVDKNGVEIYEGDIIAINKELLGCYVVRYDGNFARFSMYTNEYEQAGFNKETMKAYEVIGNIYDNPELL